MVLGLRCCSPARRPHSASLSVRVPTLAHLLAASFSLALTGSALQFSYRYHHRSGRGPFIPIVLAHAGHTSAAFTPLQFANAARLPMNFEHPARSQVEAA